jgi:hypothetical protein
VLVSVSLIPATNPLLPASDIPATALRVHEYDTPPTALVAVYEKVAPLQIAAGDVVLESTGVGLTVTNTFSALLQPFALMTKE